MPAPTRLFAGLAALLLAFATPVAAQDLDAEFTLSMRGLSGGRIGIKGRDGDGSYAVSAAATSAGLVGAFLAYKFDGQAQGTIANGRHTSTRYLENEDDGGEITSAVTLFRGTSPRSVTLNPPREAKSYDIDPTAQRDVVDPLTATYLVLRDTSPAAACAQTHRIFDGRHVSRLSLGPAQAGSNGTIVCGGEYRRLRGYKPKDMEERTATPLTFVYVPAGKGLVHVSEIRSTTKYGEAVLRRR